MVKYLQPSQQLHKITGKHQKYISYTLMNTHTKLYYHSVNRTRDISQNMIMTKETRGNKWKHRLDQTIYNNTQINRKIKLKTPSQRGGNNKTK